MTETEASICAGATCERNISGQLTRGMCRTHYSRVATAARKAGQPLTRSRKPGCEVEGCTSEFSHARGLCSKHYRRWQQQGDPTWEPTPRSEPCIVPDCTFTAKGTHRGMCATHWTQWRRATPPEQRPAHVYDKAVGCSVDDCPSEHWARGMCVKHYARTMRHGSPHALLIGTRDHRVTSNGYIERRYPDHPIVPKSGWMVEHRAVLYDHIGPADHPCHWCGRTLRWLATYQVDPDALIVDHLDWDKQNNDPSNLVPSCNVCNIQRVNPLVRRSA